MTQKKLTKENAKSLYEAADIIQGCFNWGDTDEGVHFWGGVVELLRSKASNGTSDGMPWVDPEPPIPEGWRRADHPDDYTRDDVKFWHKTEKSWMERPCMGDPFDPPKCNTRYIVPIDPPLTDQDACVWPRRWVMVRDKIDRPWEGPLELQGVSKNGSFRYPTNDPKNGICEYYRFARRATPEEIEAANGNS
jgi:hypothetical protein